MRVAFMALFVLQFVGCLAPQEYQLQVPYQRQVKGNYCVPACAAMVLKFYGDTLSQDSIKHLAKSASDFQGTYYSDLVKGLNTIGYHWEIRTFALDHNGFRQGLNMIRFALNKNEPVLISTSMPPIGHTMVVMGLIDSLSLIGLVDPARPSPGRRWISYENLEQIWHDDFQNSVRAILLTDRKR